MSTAASTVGTDFADDGPAWRRFICRACGLVYDEKDGDSDGGLPPGTRFEDIPDDWACPLCGVSKRDFDPYAGRTSGPVSARLASGVPVVSRGRRGVVIVGGGLAGWSTARALRKKDPDLPITLVSGDAADDYAKPALSLAFGHRRSAPDLIASFGADVADDLSVRLVTNAYAVAVDAPRKRLRTTRGNFDYDALVLTVGARPIEVPALPRELCWRINSLAAWKDLHAALRSGPARIVVVGGRGWSAARWTTTWRMPDTRSPSSTPRGDRSLRGLRPRSRNGSSTGGRRSACASCRRPRSQRWNAPPRRMDRLRGGQTRCPATPSWRCRVSCRIPGRERSARTAPVVVRCGDGSTHEADVVIAAIGLAVDTRLARTAGVAVDAGIAVDATTHATSVSSIYAAGDCVSIDGKACRFIEPIVRQADAIAAAILGQPVSVTTFRAPLVRLKTRSAPRTLSARR